MAPVPGLSKQLAITLVATLNSAFAATTNPDGTFTGHWTDDGGNARTLLVRGAWSADRPNYPQLAVFADPGAQVLTGAGGLVGMTTVNGIQTPRRGGILGRAEVHCLLRCQSEDEREQLSDQLRALQGGSNANGVPWWHVLKTTGFEPLWWDRNRYGQERQAGDPSDPAHGPVVFTNDLVLFARAEYVSVPTVTALQTITLRDTLKVWIGAGPPLTL
jgi:hypothetical protein